MTPLNRDAQALIRSARGGHEPSAEQQAALLDAFALERSGVPLRRQTSASRPRVRLRAPRRVAWAVAGLMITASLGAAASFTKMLRVFGLVPSAAVETSTPMATPPTPTHKAQRRGTRGIAAPGVAASQLEVENSTPEDLPAEGALTTEPPSVPEQLPQAVPTVALVRAPLPEHPLPTTGRERDVQARKSQPSVSLEDELALIGRARDALKRQAFDETRALTREHGQRFPRGQLTEERQAIEALVACRSTGNTRPAESFLQRFQNSLFAPRLRKDCGL